MMDVLNLALSLGLQLAGAVLLAVATAGAARLADWLRLSADDKARAALLAIVEVAVNAAEAELRRRFAGAPVLGITMPERAAAVARAADYVAGRAPEYLHRFGVDDVGLRAMIDKRLAARAPG